MGRKFILDENKRILSRLRTQTSWQTHSPAITTACIKVSANSLSCSGDFLAVQLEWCRKHFENVVICVADLVLEYDYSVLGHSLDGSNNAIEPLQIAEQEGDLWEKENMPLVKKILNNKNHTIYRSKYWRNHYRFNDFMKILNNLYQSNNEFRTSTQNDVLAYLKRKAIDRKFTFQEIDYLAMHTLEEIAYDNIQAETSPTLFVYAGSQPESYRYLRKNELPTNLNYLEYRYLDLIANH
jgi:hypothetical protein